MKTTTFQSKVTTSTFALLLTATGCIAHHVQLQAPESDAPVEERRTAYESLQPVSITETHITTFNKWGAPIAATRRTDHLQLRGGERVSEPEDLWPVIERTSAAANAVTRYEDNASSVRTATWIAAGFLTAGLGMSTYSLLHRNSDGSRNNTPMYLGLGAMTVGVGFAFWGQSAAHDANDEKSTAFETYDDALKTRLNLCDSGNDLADCNAPKEKAPSTKAKSSSGDDEETRESQ